MIKSLRKKFTIIAMCSMFLVLATIMTGLNVANYISLTRDAAHLLDMIAENDGSFPMPPEENQENTRPEDQNPPKQNYKKQTDTGKIVSDIPPEKPTGSGPENGITPESPYDTRFFTVWLDADNQVTSALLDNIAAVTEDSAKEYAIKAVSSSKKEGFLNVYRFRIVPTDSGHMAIFLDRQRELSTFKNNLLISITVSAAGLLAVFLLVVFFSRIVFRPVEESYQKQKRFITDASHEIKTPLTIIDANLEVVEMLTEENEWTKSIRNQVKRLASLTKQLVMLSKLEEQPDSIEREDFSLSELTEESVQSFSALALTGDKKLEMQVEQNLQYHGDEKAISQLIGILIDNAIKYSLPESTIQVSLKKQKRRIHLEVYNQAENLPKGNLNILFDRFYRTDSSRNSETGGSGIGLSIAHAIVTSHKGTITAHSDDGKSLSIVVKL